MKMEISGQFQTGQTVNLQNNMLKAELKEIL